MSFSRLTRRSALQGFGSLGLATALPFSRVWADGASLSFLAVGDWGRGGDFHQRDVAIRMGETARALNSRFVISVGDNFYEDGVASVDDPAWTNSFEAVYDAPSLQIPWHVALGNHDYHGNSQAQLDYSAKSSRWRLPTRWYNFEERAPDGSLTEFFVVDTSPMVSIYYEDGAVKVKVGDQKQNVPVQLAWLDAKLAASRADWKIVVGHHPIYSGKLPKGVPAHGEDGNRTGGSPDLIARLDPILQRHGVALYLNGHDHDLQHALRGATHYVCTGAGSKTAPQCGMAGSDFCSLQSGFVACAVNRQLLRVAYRDYTGAELYVADIPRPA
ncbi:MAG TPA: tartrate-resistant acid phosphatase type 5 family protein [Rhizomicrobium sp.]|nr:tartrate-resistant acid phosphatase type 5 family protein [Rhizomicrobium sp.]